MTSKLQPNAVGTEIKERWKKKMVRILNCCCVLNILFIRLSYYAFRLKKICASYNYHTPYGCTREKVIYNF